MTGVLAAGAPMAIIGFDHCTSIGRDTACATLPENDPNATPALLMARRGGQSFLKITGIFVAASPSWPNNDLGSYYADSKDVHLMTNAILRVRCPDHTGIIAALFDFVFRHGGNILDLDQHTDLESSSFFMRLVWSLDRFTLDADGIRLTLDAFTRSLGPHGELDFDDRRDRVAVFCSKEALCLYDLLLRQRLGELSGDVGWSFQTIPITALPPNTSGFRSRWWRSAVKTRRVPKPAVRNCWNSTASIWWCWLDT